MVEQDEASALGSHSREFANEALLFYVVELLAAIAGGIYLTVQLWDHPARPFIGLVAPVWLAVHQAVQVLRISVSKTPWSARLERIATLAETNSVIWLVIMLLYVVILSMS